MEENNRGIGKVIAIIVAILLVLGLILFFVFRGRTDEKKDITTTTPTVTNNATPGITEKPTQEGAMQNEGDIGAHHVTIKEHRIVQDADGRDAIIITYIVKNNDNAAMNFATVLQDKAYQGEEELMDAVLKDIENFDAESITKSIEKGASHEVHRAFRLKDATTPVQIEVKQLGSTSGKAVEKTFEIKQP